MTFAEDIYREWNEIEIDGTKESWRGRERARDGEGEREREREGERWRGRGSIGLLLFEPIHYARTIICRDSYK